jgi:RNA recognition motif-containing protein
MPFAFVHYESCEEAETALKNAPGKFLNGRRIRVEKAKVNRSLFIKFPDNKSTPEIFQNLKKFGTIEKFIRGKSGSAFVKYNFREDALDAFSSLKQENNVNAEWVSSKNYIFISNLDVTVDYCKLYNRFSNHGDITNFQLFYYYDLKNIFALINYKLHDSCIDAVINEVNIST